ncbi:tetratricopeptide repeat protein [Pseudomonas sp. ZM23]|uniref:Tetratricopeptide repeat protein n=1 Tax=Pseudomonas triclosanedens TaxID=2961893 RepID=A0ABY6ZXV2_9PSED|nr:tetratricopeptide repeat protein [Pseudomonas triclosanedens]MCP8465470.1 tetratricopeptide repeat protein [Pseudomonas triclosanedens]MCP8470590.1 tetratricopeptide repeat protein [Pseudomonas triclosanedens]MCP8476769.1 tetratricopeptide repeat protein [Pseudomonas triclosanedens]WAI48783.1 tetratricopeptide repeat protein [Pseudomonas triclosanedens]
MRKAWYAASASLVLLAGCSTPQHGAIPVQDSGTSVSYQEQVGGRRAQAAAVPGAGQSIPQGDSGVTVMVPQDAGAAPIQTFPAQTGAAPISTAPIGSGSTYAQPPVSTTGSITSAGGFQQQTYQQPAYQGGAAQQGPSGIPSSNTNLAADEQLDGPVLALLTTASQQQGGGDLNGAAASLERAQRIAPREPQVLYKLAQVRLAQGDAAQAEQVARRGLSLANGRPTMQASLWDLIAKCREQQGDASGAAEARQRAKVTL